MCRFIAAIIFVSHVEVTGPPGSAIGIVATKCMVMGIMMGTVFNSEGGLRAKYAKLTIRLIYPFFETFNMDFKPFFTVIKRIKLIHLIKCFFFSFINKALQYDVKHIREHSHEHDGDTITISKHRKSTKKQPEPLFSASRWQRSRTNTINSSK